MLIIQEGISQLLLLLPEIQMIRPATPKIEAGSTVEFQPWIP